MALEFEESLKEMYRKTWRKDEYRYYHNDVAYYDLKLEDNTWNALQYVMIDEATKTLLGFIFFTINRAYNNITGIALASFIPILKEEGYTEEQIKKYKRIFAADLKQSLTDIFDKYNFHKISFAVVIGNPVEKQYDAIIKQMGGRIVGIVKDEVKLNDNKYYDEKLYEILQNEYNKSKEKKR